MRAKKDMNKETALRADSSLLERAAEMYDFNAELRRPAPAPQAEPVEGAEAAPSEAAFAWETPRPQQRALAP